MEQNAMSKPAPNKSFKLLLWRDLFRIRVFYSDADNFALVLLFLDYGAFGNNHFLGRD
jgi:hypothetical protein